MINFKKLLETVYEPKAGDEKNFKDKHIIAKHKTPFESESQFTSNAKKAKRPADHDTGEDEAVYEAANVHTKRADKEAVIVRAVDPKTGQSKAKVVQRRAGEIKIGEEVELDEKVKNPYAIGMAAAMKSTGDTPPLKKSTINKSHEIARSIKKEALDPVGKHDADIDNDGDKDKSDKYLINRRKAIGKALRKEEVELDEAAEYSMKQLKKKFDDGTHEAMNDPVPGRHVELRNTKTGKRTTHYVKEDTQLDELSPNTLHSYIKKATPDIVGRTMSAVSSNQSAETKKHASKLGNRIKGITGASGRLSDKANAVNEEAEQIDELSDDKLRDYHAKAGTDRQKAKGEVEKGMAAKKFTPASVQKTTDSYKRFIKRGKGMTTAANKMSEEVDSGENTAEADNTTFKAYVKGNKPVKIKDVTEEDAKTNSEASHKKYVKSNVKAPHQSFKEEVEQIDELSKKTLGSYINKSAADVGYIQRDISDEGTKSANYKNLSRLRKNRKAGIANAVKSLTKEEAENLKELSKKTLGSYVRKASDRVASNSAEYRSVHSGEDSNRGTFADRLKYKKELSRDTNKRKSGMDTALNKLTKEDLDEAFKVGSMKLHDGSAVTLTRESVDSLNGLFHQLNGANKAKMEERMMSGKKGFQEILSFAENV